VNASTEKSYYRILEKIITETKLGSRFYDRRRSPRYARDIERLFLSISKNFPQFKKLLLPRGRYTSVPAVDVKRLDYFTAHSEKGSLVKYFDKKGNITLCGNAGKNIFTKKTRIITFSSGASSLKENEALQNIIFFNFLKRDIEQVYEKIRIANTFRSTLKHAPSRQAPPAVQKLSSNSFEASFKRLIRRCGPGVDALAAAQTIVRTMNSLQKSSLSHTLSALGVKDFSGLSSLLTKWKEEALQTPPHTRALRRSLTHTLEAE
jgi:hypothetical protein